MLRPISHQEMEIRLFRSQHMLRSSRDLLGPQYEVPLPPGCLAICAEVQVLDHHPVARRTGPEDVLKACPGDSFF